MEHCKHKCSPDCKYFPMANYSQGNVEYGYDEIDCCYKPKNEIQPRCFRTEKTIKNWKSCKLYSPRITSNKKIIVVIGKSASGKDTAQKILDEQFGIKPIVTLTTRPVRDGEENGKDYWFVSKEEFEQKIKNNKMADMRKYHTCLNGINDVWYYGVQRKDLQDLETRSVCVDIVGYRNLTMWFSKREMLIVNIKADEPVRRKRAMERGSFDVREWERRVIDDDEKFNDETVGIISDYIINNNGELENLQKGLEEILKNERVKIKTE